MVKIRGEAEIDRQVGAAVRAARRNAGLSMEKLATPLGITWQQLWKNESGRNRIGAGRLYLIAKALGVPVASLFPSGDNDAP